ncbi:Ankyrin repeat domain-containing protein 24 [Merluccius polli]|uniref:Ankyrin repeat domain-containing protein 24 n=1 Tax=Merluccius polli TaxID=89951 RepID=A0AA47P3S7_MERPO|nr:Ankyrin repeat domain-containing protein 24 [Merluccius polli]
MTLDHCLASYHLCASKGRLDCLEVIISHGADLKTTDGAAISGCLSCTETLWDFKAYLDSQDEEGATPLILAAQMSRVELCAFLMERGANANIQDKQGRSALMLACESDGVETVEVLLRGGANMQLIDALGHNATHYGVATGNQCIIHLLQNGAPPKPQCPPTRSLSPEPQPRSPSPTPPSPGTERPAQANLTEDEEVFEEIRRLRLERGRLLQKIKGLEQQQQSAVSAVEELSQLKERLAQAEAERDRLRGELEDVRRAHSFGPSDSEDMDEMLDFPEKLLSRRSRASPAPDEACSLGVGPDLSSPSPVPRERGSVAQLHRQIEELTSQNSELVLKVQMLEMFEKDDTDMQSSSPDFVPLVQYETLRKELEALQDRLSQAQRSQEASNVSQEPQDEEAPNGGAEGESARALREKVQELEEQLTSSRAEVEELKEQMELGVFSVEHIEGTATTATATAKQQDEEGGVGGIQEAQQLRGRVRELEELLASNKQGEGEAAGGASRRDSDAIKQLTAKVEELQAALAERESSAREAEKGDREGGETEKQELRDTVSRLEAELAESREGGRAERGSSRVGVGADGELVRRLQGRLGELEAQLRRCVPRSELEEVQVSLGVQCERLARERSEVATRLNTALLELERLRPPPLHHRGGEEEEEDEEDDSERSESSERSIASEPRRLASVREELEVARQEAAQALDCLCAEREARAQDTVSLSKHKEALSAVSEQLAQSLRELQGEKDQRERLSQLEGQLQGLQDSVPKEQHETVKAELQRTLQASEQSAAAAREALSEKELELRELKSQKAAEQGLISKEEHEAQRLALQAEINSMTARFNDLTRKHEKTCTEVQRDALFNKSERQAAEAQLAAVQKQMTDLQAQSSHVQELHKNVQESQGQVKEKDRKITDLSKEVFRLKEALGALSPPLGITSSSLSPAHHNNPGQQVALQNRVAILTQQLQGRMDEEVQNLLLQILKMTHKEQGH